MYFIKLFIISGILVGGSIFLLSVRILFRKFILNKKGYFPPISIGGNKYLREKGIKCPKHEECKAIKNYK